MDSPIEHNRDLWNEITPMHVGSAFYDVAGFKAGRNTLRPLEMGDVGDVKGKKLLHLQCHFGMDTLSWARLGASVTGVDISEVAISQAQDLSRDLSIPARFVCCNLYDLPNVLQGQFDIVRVSKKGLFG